MPALKHHFNAMCSGSPRTAAGAILGHSPQQQSRYLTLGCFTKARLLHAMPMGTWSTTHFTTLKMQVSVHVEL